MAARFPSRPCEPGHAAANRRFALMLAASALLHLSFVKVLVVEAPSGGAQPAAAAPMHVRLEPASPPQAPEPTPAPAVTRPSRAATGARPTGPAREDANPGAAAVSIAPRELPDPVYYPARELDSYPRPVAPLKFDILAGTAPDSMPGRAQLMLQINEHGAVDRVSVVELEPRGRFEDALRAALLQTQFLPALKDGRPVKSRILLSISFAAAGENRGQP